MPKKSYSYCEKWLDEPAKMQKWNTCHDAALSFSLAHLDVIDSDGILPLST